MKIGGERERKKKGKEPGSEIVIEVGKRDLWDYRREGGQGEASAGSGTAQSVSETGGCTVPEQQDLSWRLFQLNNH